MKTVAVISFLVLHCCLVSTVSAEEPDEAKRLFKESVELFKTGEFQRAVDGFRKANELNPTWRLLYNIGQCEAALKNYGKAYIAFEAYLVEGGDEVQPERQDEIRSELDRLSDLSGVLEVSAPNGSTIYIDNDVRGKTPLEGPIRVAAGRHTVTIKLDEVSLLERTIAVGGRGAKVSIGAEATQGPENEEVTPTEQEDSDYVSTPVENDRSKLVTMGWVFSGIGLAVAAGGGVSGALALKNYGSLQDDCPNNTCETQDSLDKGETADNLALVTDILIPVGAAAITTGIIMVIVGKKKESAGPVEVGVSPVLGPNQGGFAIKGRF